MIFEVLSLIDFPSGSHFQNLFSDRTILHRTFFSEIDLAENELLFTKSLSALAGLFHSITGSVDTCTKVLVQTLRVRRAAVSPAAKSLLASCPSRPGPPPNRGTGNRPSRGRGGPDHASRP